VLVGLGFPLGYLNPTLATNAFSPAEAVEVYPGLFRSLKQGNTFIYFNLLLIRQKGYPFHDNFPSSLQTLPDAFNNVTIILRCLAFQPFPRKSILPKY
jgi:hypothetical protein